MSPEGKRKIRMEADKQVREEVGEKRKRVEEKEEYVLVVKRECVNPTIVEVFDMFNPGRFRSVNRKSWGDLWEDSSGIDSDCESVTWSSAPVVTDAHVLLSYAVEVMVSWGFTSDCGSVAVSDVPVVTDVYETAPSVVTVMCEGVPSDSEWDFVEPQSSSFSKRCNFACVECQEDMNFEGMMTPVPQQSSFSSMDSGKDGCCTNGAVREQE